MKKILLISSLIVACATASAQTWQLVADTSISVMGPATIQFHSLDSGREYKMVSSGIWGDYWSLPHYDTRYNIDAVGYPAMSDLGSNWFVQSPAWLNTLAPTPNVYDTTGHTYTYLFTDTVTEDIVLHFQDNGYTDNYGSVRFQLYVNCPNEIHPMAADIALCGAQGVVLVADSATNYTWYDAPTGGNVLSSDDSLSLATISSTDTFYVSTMHFAGCESDRDEVIVTVNALPSVAFTLPSTADTICLSDAMYSLSGESPMGGVFSGTAVSGNLFDPNAAGTGVHTITYSYTDINGCTSAATDDIDVDICLGMLQNAEETISVYPNPAAETLHIINADGATAEILNAQGQLVSVSVLNSDDATIDVSALADGMYFLRVISNDTLSSTTFQKQ